MPGEAKTWSVPDSLLGEPITPALIGQGLLRRRRARHRHDAALVAALTFACVGVISVLRDIEDILTAMGGIGVDLPHHPRYTAR